jgi:3',5'-cyclic AMP phosphodiesterase CpdA
MKEGNSGWRGIAAGFQAAFLLLALALLAIDLICIPLVDEDPPPILPPAGEVLPGAAPYVFAVVGDSQGTPTVYDTMVKQIQQDGAAFVLHCGDLVQRCTANRYRWTLHEMAEQNLGVPFCPVPGNHDVQRPPGGEGESDKRLYKRSFGQPHYWFAYDDTLFVAVDTSDRGLREAELAWLDSTLAVYRARYKTCIVFTHVPPRNPLPIQDRDLGAEADRLVAVLAKWHVTALFAGHLHSYAEDEMRGVPVYISGGGGADLDLPDDHYSYLLCRIGPDGQLAVEKREVPTEPNRDYFEYVARAKLGRQALGATGVLLLLASVGCAVAARSWRPKQP